MINSYKQYTAAGLIAIATFLISSWGFSFYNQIDLLNQIITERQDLLENRTKVINNIEALNNKLADKAEDIKKISNIVPNKKSSAELVSTVDDIARRNGVAILGLSISNQSTDPGSGSSYNVVLIDLNLSGSYQSLVSTLKSLEKNLRLLDVVQISANSNSFNTDILTFNVRANAYFLK